MCGGTILVIKIWIRILCHCKNSFEDDNKINSSGVGWCASLCTGMDKIKDFWED